MVISELEMEILVVFAANQDMDLSQSDRINHLNNLKGDIRIRAPFFCIASK